MGQILTCQPKDNVYPNFQRFGYIDESFPALLLYIYVERLEVLKSSKMGPHIVLILLKSPLFFPNEIFLTSSPQSKISFMGALYI